MQALSSYIFFMSLLLGLSLATTPSSTLSSSLTLEPTIPTIIGESKDVSDWKFINTKVYHWKNGSSQLIVHRENPSYELLSGSASNCSNIHYAELQQVRAVSSFVDSVLVTDRHGKLFSYSLSPNGGDCPRMQKVYDEVNLTVSLDVHRNMAVFLAASAYSDRSLVESFTVLKLAAYSDHVVKAQFRGYINQYPYMPLTKHQNSMTALAILGRTADFAVVFMTSGLRGIVCHYGSLEDGKLIESKISAGTELETATKCTRVARLGVSDLYNLTTTVSLAVVCENVDKPALYIVQVPVENGVPQKLTVTAKVVLVVSDTDDFVSSGGIAYLDGSLVFATPKSVFNFIITNPLSVSPVVTLRSWFQSSFTFSGIDLLTSDVAAVSVTSETLSTSPVVLNLASSTVIHGLLTPSYPAFTDFTLLYSHDALAVTRLSDTVFVTAGGFGNSIRRWESCASNKNEYTVVSWKALENTRGSYVCSCPDEKVCLLGRTYETCPTNTTHEAQKCVPDTGFYADRPTMSVLKCPAGNACSEGTKIQCLSTSYQPHEGQSGCWICPENTTVTTDHTTCTVSDGFYVSKGSFATNDAKVKACEGGYKCTNGNRTLGVPIIVGIAVSVVVVLVLVAAGVVFHLHRRGTLFRPKGKGKATAAEMSQV